MQRLLKLASFVAFFESIASTTTAEPFDCHPSGWFYGWSSSLSMKPSTIQAQNFNSLSGLLVGGKIENEEEECGETRRGFLTVLDGISHEPNWFVIFESLVYAGDTYKVTDIDAFVSFEHEEFHYAVVPALQKPPSGKDIAALIFFTMNQDGLAVYERKVFENGELTCGVHKNQVFSGKGPGKLAGIALKHCNPEKMALSLFYPSRSLENVDRYWYTATGVFQTLSLSSPNASAQSAMMLGTYLYLGLLQSTKIVVFSDDGNTDLKVSCSFSFYNDFELQNSVIPLKFKPKFSFVGQEQEPEFFAFYEMVTPGPFFVIVSFQGRVCEEQDYYVQSFHDVSKATQLTIVSAIYAGSTVTILLKDVLTGEFLLVSHKDQDDFDVLFNKRFSVSEPNLVNYKSLMNPSSNLLYALQQTGSDFALVTAGVHNDFTYVQKVTNSNCVQEVSLPPITWDQKKEQDQEVFNLGVGMELLASSKKATKSTFLGWESCFAAVESSAQKSVLYKNPCAVQVDADIQNQFYLLSSGDQLASGLPIVLDDLCMDFDLSQINYKFEEMKVGITKVYDCVYDTPQMYQTLRINTNDEDYVGIRTVKYKMGYLNTYTDQLVKSFLLWIYEDSCVEDLVNCCVTYPDTNQFFTYELNGNPADWKSQIGEQSNGDCDFYVSLQLGSTYQASGGPTLPAAFTLTQAVTSLLGPSTYGVTTVPTITTQSSDLSLAGFYTLVYTVHSKVPLSTAQISKTINFYLRNPNDCVLQWTVPPAGSKDLTVQVLSTASVSLEGFHSNFCKYTYSLSSTLNGLVSVEQCDWCFLRPPNSFSRQGCNPVNWGAIRVTPTSNDQAGEHFVDLILQSNRYPNDPAMTTFKVKITVTRCYQVMTLPKLSPNEFNFVVGDKNTTVVSLPEFDIGSTCKGFSYSLVCSELQSNFIFNQTSQDGTKTEFFTDDVRMKTIDISCVVTGQSSIDTALVGKVGFVIHLRNPCFDTTILYPTPTMPSKTIQAGTEEDIFWLDFTTSASASCDIQYTVSRTLLAGSFAESWQTVSVSQKLINIKLPAAAAAAELFYNITARINGDDSFPGRTVSFRVTILNPNHLLLVPEVTPLPLNTTTNKTDEEASKNSTEFDILSWTEKLNAWGKQKATKGSVPLFAYVYSIDNKGLLTVNFTKPLLIPPMYQNLTLEKEAGTYNETIHLVIALAVESDTEIDPKFQAGNIVMFNLTNFTTWGIAVQITFEKPSFISTDRLNPDKLRIDFIQADVFVDKRDLQRLDFNTTLISELPPQLTAEEALISEELQKSAQTTGNVLGYLTIVFQLGLSYALKYVWNMFNLLQFFAFIEKWKGLRIPQTPALDFVVFVRQICLQEFIPYAWFTKKVESLLGLADEDVLEVEAAAGVGNSTDFNSTQRNDTNQTNSNNSTRRRLQTLTTAPKKKSGLLQDMGVMLLICVVLLVVVVLLMLVRLTVNYNYKCYRLYMNIQQKIFFNAFIRYVLQSVLKMLFAAVAQYQLSSQLGDQAQYTPLYWVSLVMMGFFMLAPIVFFIILWKNKEALPKPSMKAKIGSLYLGTHTTDVFTIMYSSVFLLRRLLFVILAWQLTEYPAIQVQIFIFSNVVYAIYLHKAMPHEDRHSAVTETFNEAMFMICIYHFLPFCGFVDDPDMLFGIGVSLASIVGFMFIFNIFVIIFVTQQGIVRLCYLKRLRKRKIQERQQKMKNLVNILLKKAQESRERLEQAEIAKQLAKREKNKKKSKPKKQKVPKVKTGIPKVAGKTQKVKTGVPKKQKVPKIKASIPKAKSPKKKAVPIHLLFEEEKVPYNSQDHPDSNDDWWPRKADQTASMFEEPILAKDHYVALFHKQHFDPNKNSQHQNQRPLYENNQKQSYSLEISSEEDDDGYGRLPDNKTYLEKSLDELHQEVSFSSSLNSEEINREAFLMFRQPMTVERVISKFHGQSHLPSLTIRTAPVASLKPSIQSDISADVPAIAHKSKEISKKSTAKDSVSKKKNKSPEKASKSKSATKKAKEVVTKALSNFRKKK